MSEPIEFVRNYSDLSTDKGFQFEFHCDRCGTGYRTQFQASATGTITSALDAASGLLGGLFSSAANVSSRVHSAAWERSHDKHFVEAIEELRPSFAQCPHCQGWVCRKSCWNTKRGLCKNCAPDLGVEMSAAQAQQAREEIWAHARMADEDKQIKAEDWRETIVATCPKCEATLAAKAKFCPECGHKLQIAAHCSECGAKLNAGAKFCGECGTKAE
ncbi:MAG: zinc ribbon domain-containing protein [Fimbriimonadaceae bacterium]|nr:zinc ribbon domain-containing protein [Fimbriimonadaceae bacterium]